MCDSIRIEEIAAVWLARRDRDGWSTADQAALNGWLDESTANRVAYIRLQAAWRQTHRLKALAGIHTPGVRTSTSARQPER